MTRYTVVWTNKATEQLATLFLRAEDQHAVSVASNSIDVELAIDPERKDERFSGRSRTLTVAPLTVLYQVIEPDRMVRVMLVKSEVS